MPKLRPLIKTKYGCTDVLQINATSKIKAERGRPSGRRAALAVLNTVSNTNALKYPVLCPLQFLRRLKH